MPGKIEEGARALRRDDRGQDLAEYGIALAVIAAGAGLIAVFIGQMDQTLWNNARGMIGDVLSAF